MHETKNLIKTERANAKNSETLVYETTTAKETVTKNYEESYEDFWNTNEKFECQLRVSGYNMEDKDKEMDKLKEEKSEV